MATDGLRHDIGAAAAPKLGVRAAAPAPVGARASGRPVRTVRCETYAGQLLSQLPLFAGVAGADIDGLCRDASVMRASTGQPLFAAGDKADGLFIVILGRVRLHLGAGAGNRVIAVMERGDCIGLAVILRDGTYPVSGVAAEDCVLVRLPAGTVRRLMSELPLVSGRLVQDMAVKLGTFVRDIGGYTQRSARGRVATMLLDLLRDGADDGENVAFREPKRLIASRLAMTPETLSRELGALAVEGVIDSQRNRFRVLDLAALRKAADEGVRQPDRR